jgi:hypothetical protein
MRYRPPYKKILIWALVGAFLGVMATIFIGEPMRCYLGKPCLWRDGWYS